MAGVLRFVEDCRNQSFRIIRARLTLGMCHSVHNSTVLNLRLVVRTSARDWHKGEIGNRIGRTDKLVILENMINAPTIVRGPILLMVLNERSASEGAGSKHWPLCRCLLGQSCCHVEDGTIRR